ncbi:unnamed protein product [Coffea canephora]|uniref:DH200=94 genomic scaffold, scaffold_3555 n=1 Tax=Coffea canephora TaxID=49390 RepID=A0A068VKK9_COFCA|nr:unnamed protein product [Coffea canephora]
MTQKSYLFKCQRKKKSIPPNRHGNAPQIRKRVVKPSKVTKDMDTDQVSLFILVVHFFICLIVLQKRKLLFFKCSIHILMLLSFIDFSASRRTIVETCNFSIIGGVVLFF